MKEAGFEIRKDYNQLTTCVCFRRNDVFVTIYNKVVQRFETNLVTKKIGNGFQTVFGSEEIAQKFLKNQKKSFFRVELRYVFDERELSFMEENSK